MSERDQHRKDRYRRVRSDFDELNTEDKVVFLLEATVSTVARGIDEFGRVLSDELGKAFSRRRKSNRNGDGAPGKETGSGTGSAQGGSGERAERGPGEGASAERGSGEGGSREEGAAGGATSQGASEPGDATEAGSEETRGGAS